MNKICQSTAVASLVACAASARPTAAQGVPSINPLKARLKIGVLLPNQSNTRTFTGSTHFNAEADIAVPNLGQGRTYATIGYSQGSKHGGKLRSIPLTLTRIFSPPNPVSGVTGNVYFGLGAGAYFLRASGGGVSESKTRLGGFGVVGYNFPNPFFVEAKYQFVGKVAGVSPTGLALMVGRRF